MTRILELIDSKGIVQIKNQLTRRAAGQLIFV